MEAMLFGLVILALLWLVLRALRPANRNRRRSSWAFDGGGDDGGSSDGGSDGGGSDGGGGGGD